MRVNKVLGSDFYWEEQEAGGRGGWSAVSMSEVSFTLSGFSDLLAGLKHPICVCPLDKRFSSPSQSQIAVPKNSYSSNS